MIAPEGEGVALQPWPALEVNGQKQVIRGSLAPWSDAWNRPPNAASLLNTSSLSSGAQRSDSDRRAKSLAQRAAAAHSLYQGTDQASRPGPAAPYGDSAYAAAGRWASTPGSISVSGVGDRMIAAAQGGVGPRGEVGTWLIIYRLEGSDLRKVASTFIRPEGAPPATSPRGEAAP
jgi:hypothetical protein